MFRKRSSYWAFRLRHSHDKYPKFVPKKINISALRYTAKKARRVWKCVVVTLTRYTHQPAAGKLFPTNQLALWKLLLRLPAAESRILWLCLPSRDFQPFFRNPAPKMFALNFVSNRNEYDREYQNEYQGRKTWCTSLAEMMDECSVDLVNVAATF